MCGIGGASGKSGCISRSCSRRGSGGLGAPGRGGRNVSQKGRGTPTPTRWRCRHCCGCCRGAGAWGGGRGRRPTWWLRPWPWPARSDPSRGPSGRRACRRLPQLPLQQQELRCRSVPGIGAALPVRPLLLVVIGNVSPTASVVDRLMGYRGRGGGKTDAQAVLAARWYTPHAPPDWGWQGRWRYRLLRLRLLLLLKQLQGPQMPPRPPPVAVVAPVVVTPV